MIFHTRQPPAAYSLCNQVVTIYHAIGMGQAFSCTRTVFDGAFLDFKKVSATDQTGSHETNRFLLVLPSGWDGRPCWMPQQEYDAAEQSARRGRFTLAANDKVLLGTGAQIETREEWARLLPANGSGLVVVQDVDPKYWQGSVCHIEAGG